MANQNFIGYNRYQLLTDLDVDPNSLCSICSWEQELILSRDEQHSDQCQITNKFRSTHPCYWKAIERGGWSWNAVTGLPENGVKWCEETAPRQSQSSAETRKLWQFKTWHLPATKGGRAKMATPGMWLGGTSCCELVVAGQAGPAGAASGPNTAGCQTRWGGLLCEMLARGQSRRGDVAGGGTEPVGGWQGQGVHHSQGAQARHGVSCRRWIKVFHLVSMWTWPHCSVGSDHLILLHTELIRFVSCTALVSEKSITLFSDTLTGLMCWKKKANTGFSLLYICSCCKAVLAVWKLLRRGNIQRGRWPACCIGHLCARKAVCSCTRSCTWKLRICP